MHHVLSSGKYDPQDNDENKIRGRRQPVDVDNPQTNLEEQANNRERHRKAEARLGKEESVPVGFHRPQRKRNVRDPEKDSGASEGGGPAMERVPAREEADQARQSRESEGKLRRQHPRAVQIHHADIRSKRLIRRTE